MSTPQFESRLLRALAAFFGALRGVWIVMGATLLMLLMLELAYRGQASLRKALRSSAPAGSTHPYAAMPWFEGYRRERALTESPSRALVWSSYVYWRREPFSGTYINVDSAGHRVTPQPPAAGDGRPVWFFGGSTMWGTFQRDSATIPAVAAGRWAGLGLPDLRVVNRGEYGYVFTQEVLALELALRAGARPAAVVFLDGLNDVAATVINDSAGLPQNEARRAQEFRQGRLMSPELQGTADEGRALGATAFLVLGRSALAQRLFQAGAGAVPNRRASNELGRETARVYAATAEWVEALAGRYGFVPYYFWQPSLATTRKPLSAFERALEAQAPPHLALRVRGETGLAAEAELAQLMPAVAGPRFVNLARLFDGDTTTVFLDDIGHTTEAAAARIATAFADTMEPALRRPAGVGRGTPVAPRR